MLASEPCPRCFGRGHVAIAAIGEAPLEEAYVGTLPCTICAGSGLVDVETRNRFYERAAERIGRLAAGKDHHAL